MKDADSAPALPAAISAPLLALLCASSFGGCAHGPAGGSAGSYPATQGQQGSAAQGAGAASLPAQPALSLRPSGSNPKAPLSEAEAKGRTDLEQALEALRGVAVHFRPGEAALSPEAEDGLAAVGMVLARHPELGVDLEATGDAQGPWRSADELAGERAAASRRYLVKMGAREKQVAAARPGAKAPAQGGSQAARKD
jgi:outer membrane protein OmpA-like peptidoglycan-associated protein